MGERVQGRPKASYFDRALVVPHVVGQGKSDSIGAAHEDDAKARQMAALYDYLGGRLKLRLLLDQGPGGFSVLESELAPNVRVPRHKHNVAQVALILEG